MKAPDVSTLGNIDRALKFVWEAAADAKIVNAKMRPMIDKDEFGEDGEPRSFIDREGVKAVYRVMSTDRYLYGNNGHTTDYKRMLRIYVALAATAGIRPGLELKRTMIGDIAVKEQRGKSVILILVRKNAGKHKRERKTIVYEGDVFPTREWLSDLLAWQEKRGARMTDKLFAWNDDGDVPQFREGLRDVMIEAGCL